MAIEIKKNSMNVFPKGTVLATLHREVMPVMAFVKGKIEARRDAQVHVFNNGYVGIADLYEESSLYTYTVLEDTQAFVYDVTDSDSMSSVAEARKDHRGVMVGSLLLQLDNAYNAYAQISNCSQELFEEFSLLYRLFSVVGMQEGIKVDENPFTGNIVPPSEFNAETLEALKYYKECSKIPAEVKKAFYGNSVALVMHEIPVISALLIKTLEKTEEYIRFIGDVSDYITNEKNGTIKSYIELLNKIPKGSRSSKKLAEEGKRLHNSFDAAVKIVKEVSGTEIDCRVSLAKNLFENPTAPGEASEVAMTKEEARKAYGTMFMRILKYAGMANEKSSELAELMNQLFKTKDRLSSDEDKRELRHRISKLVIELYENCMLKALKEETTSKEVELFLNFGLLDARFVTDEQLLEILNLDYDGGSENIYNVYTAMEWFKEIYALKKAPSKNELDMDYSENLRELRKTGKITDEDIKRMERDNVAKVRFELENMFRSAMRIVHGHLSTFLPFILGEQFTGNIARHFVSKAKIEESAEAVREIDFSAFYRQLQYNNSAQQVEKEIELREVLPDIILLPIYGYQSSMWQDISEKRRDSSGRFIFPIFVESKLNDLMIVTVGRFRWELCKTMQGMAWNNLREKSLTSEYYDFVEYYKKNKELSDERKEKIKTMLLKARNNRRELFAMDYELWMKYESNGTMRLSKPVREIMATWCPFSKEIRNTVCTQSLFREAYERYARELAKKIKEHELRHKAIEKRNIKIPAPLLKTLDYLKNS
ncbi:MAG: hypothetical protein MJ113_00225 [Lachnospiraceae bacterium]|nr:hypothetical protein [Lachnospiraceae bacterium]